MGLLSVSVFEICSSPELEKRIRLHIHTQLFYNLLGSVYIYTYVIHKRLTLFEKTDNIASLEKAISVTSLAKKYAIAKLTVCGITNKKTKNALVDLKKKLLKSEANFANKDLKIFLWQVNLLKLNQSL